MFKKTKRRIDSAFAKGLMFGKAVGARDERERIASLLEQEAIRHQQLLLGASAGYLSDLAKFIKREKND